MSDKEPESKFAKGGIVPGRKNTDSIDVILGGGCHIVCRVEHIHSVSPDKEKDDE